jgi:hypothetical protein
MSTNQKLTNRTAKTETSKQPDDKKAEKGQLGLSVTQILGGALAAMTAAALGSQLSVAGTVVGAALASVIAAVAGSLYTASIRRTSDKVKTVFYTGQPNEVEEPTVIDVMTDDQGHIAGQRSHLVSPEPEPPRKGGPNLNWKRVVVAALAAFGIAAVSLTAVELVTGHALSGGGGTTFQQVSGGTSEKGKDTKKKAPSEKPTKNATTASTEEPTQEPTAEPSQEAQTPKPERTTQAPTPEAAQPSKATPAPRASSSGSP